jgi:hypothetical protein
LRLPSLDNVGWVFAKAVGNLKGADPLAALILIPIIVREGWDARRGDDCADRRSIDASPIQIPTAQSNCCNCLSGFRLLLCSSRMRHFYRGFAPGGKYQDGEKFGSFATLGVLDGPEEIVSQRSGA